MAATVLYRGVWRHVRGGFEILQFRMEFNPSTAEVSNIVRIRSMVGFDGDRDHMSGAFRVAIWFCPTATTCPDPTSAAPDVPEFTPARSRSMLASALVDRLDSRDPGVIIVSL